MAEAAPLPLPVPLAGAARLRACDDCGQLVRLAALPPGVDSRCPRCDAVLRRHRQSMISTPLALVVTSLLLCLVTLTTPFLTIRLLGRMRGSMVESGAHAFLEDGLLILAVLLVATVMLVPLARLSLRLVVLAGLVSPVPPAWLHRPLRWHEHLGAWSMLEVFLFGALVSYTRLADLAEVEFGPAVYGLGAVVVAMVAADAAFEPQAAWDALEDRGVMACPAAARAESPLFAPIGCHCCRRVAQAAPGTACARCGSTLHARKPAAVARAWALIIGAVVLYIPANAYPVMTIVTLGQGGPHTIMGGVIEFVHTGFWPLALIVFTASVAVPMLKLVGLSVMLLQLGRPASLAALRRRTRLYRVIEVLGRWSMIDVFVVAVLIALVRFGVLASINAEIGAACFGAVVILTMLAAESFDPRLMWDAAAAPRKDPSP
ncbi:paraquat-inducible protein A [Roseomonas sp. USHLN139]|uniref:paraquat-inducible protein A n=1 Tax=Roseomonas sp. USHLN139 TaxID=3081298 RepID=UPI003B02778B